jgi:hypothetical protein
MQPYVDQTRKTISEISQIKDFKADPIFKFSEVIFISETWLTYLFVSVLMGEETSLNRAGVANSLSNDLLNNHKISYEPSFGLFALETQFFFSSPGLSIIYLGLSLGIGKMGFGPS